MDMFNKLTPDQRRFAIFGSASLLAVGIIIFLIYGLQGVSFGNMNKDKNAKQYMKVRDVAAQTTYQEQQQALAMQQAIVEQFPEAAEMLDPVIAMSTSHLAMLVETMEQYDIDIPKENMESIDSFDSLSDGCAEALQFELDHTDDLQGQYAQDAFVWGEVRSVFLTIANESVSMQVPILEACAQ